MVAGSRLARGTFDPKGRPRLESTAERSAAWAAADALPDPPGRLVIMSGSPRRTPSRAYRLPSGEVF